MARARDDDDRERRPAYKYRGDDRTAEDVARHSKSTGSYDKYLSDECLTFKPREGENTIRILPSTFDHDKKLVEKWGAMWDIAVHVHFSVGPDEGSYLCLKDNGEDCPICEARQDMDEDEANSIRASERRLVWLIDRDDEKSGPKLWSMPKKKVFDEIINRSIEKKTRAVIKIDHPNEGFDITFSREGTGQKTDYVGIEVSRDPTPIHENQARQDKWMAYIQDRPLPELLNFFEADYLEGVLSGRRAKRGDDDEEEDRRGSRGNGRGRSSDRTEGSGRPRRGAAVEEDENEGESRSSRRPSRAKVDDDDEEEEKRPPTKSARRGTERDDDDDDDDDEEEEEKKETPRGPRPRGSSKDDDDDDNGEGDEDLRSRPRRAASKKKEDDDEEEPRASKGAREQGSRLKTRSSR